ncbi:hypothetical protein M911_07855 [Ectothiorhodospira haloalkaliphila]|uniref:Uncharacterized protein n=1 Tax=Ectothiorhodospira haloalkaliphila TaxID=421628 RepID=W8KUK8_9GAMM|nr:hypothetical protein M911_07855 [Ectothiorhodospira haloalkaliphila]
MIRITGGQWIGRLHRLALRGPFRPLLPGLSDPQSRAGELELPLSGPLATGDEPADRVLDRIAVWALQAPLELIQDVLGLCLRQSATGWGHQQALIRAELRGPGESGGFALSRILFV